MASSKSLRKGQFPSSCKLCNTETKLSWRCIDCDILMCSRCKDTIHPNLRNASKHKVIDIKIENNIEDIIQSGDVEKIYERSNQEINFGSVPSFIPGDINPFNVGVLQQSTDIKLQPIKEYTTDISNVFYIEACKDSLYISDQKVVQNVQPDVNNLKVISIFDIKIDDMAVTPSGDLLLAPRSGSELLQISSTTNKSETNYSVHPQGFSAVHVTSDGKVVVGTMDFGDSFPVKGRRTVISMDKDGRNKTIYEYDRNNQRIFTLPRKITSTKSGNICVVDWLSSDARGRVVVLGQDGDIINIYTGHPDVNTKHKPFKPVSIVTTPSDKIIVSDSDTHTLHILSNKGQLVAHINTVDKEIQWPYSIAFTTHGKVYIGCKSFNKGKLYEVKLLE